MVRTKQHARKGTGSLKPFVRSSKTNPKFVKTLRDPSAPTRKKQRRFKAGRRKIIECRGMHKNPKLISTRSRVGYAIGSCLQKLNSDVTQFNDEVKDRFRAFVETFLHKLLAQAVRLAKLSDTSRPDDNSTPKKRKENRNREWTSQKRLQPKHIFTAFDMWQESRVHTFDVPPVQLMVLEA